MATMQALQRQGWYLSTDGITECSEEGKNNPDDIIKVALDCDLKDIGEKHLPEGINKKAVETVDGPFVLQINKVRNVSAPKDNEESQGAPALYKLTLTDGHTSCIGIDVDKIPGLSLTTPPGTKLKLLGKIPVEHGFLQLKKSNAKVLGGRVEKLVENWELKRSLAKHARSNVGTEGGPPLFVPFGQRRRDEPLAQPKKGTFRALESVQDKDKKEEDTEFEQQRQATIAEVQRAKEESGARIKSMVHNKQNEKDLNVAKIMEMGFTDEQAFTALRLNKGDLQEAINSLLREREPRPMKGAGRRDTRNGEFSGPLEKNDRPERGERGRRRQVEDDDDFNQSKPSAPATLFDFLTTKIPASKSGPQKDDSDSRDRHDSGKGDDKDHSSRSNRSSRNVSESVSEEDRRGPPNLPPRLIKQQQQREEQQRQRQQSGGNAPAPTRGGRQGQVKGERGPPRGGPPPEWYEQGGPPMRSYDRGPRHYDRGPRGGYDRGYDPRMYNQGYEQGYDQRAYDARYNRRGYPGGYDGRGMPYEQYAQGPPGYDNYGPRPYPRGQRGYDQRQQMPGMGQPYEQRNHRNNNYNGRGGGQAKHNGEKKDVDKKVSDSSASKGSSEKRTVWNEDVKEGSSEPAYELSSSEANAAAASLVENVDGAQQPSASAVVTSSPPEDMIKSIQGVAENCDKTPSAGGSDLVQSLGVTGVTTLQHVEVVCSNNNPVLTSSHHSSAGVVVSSVPSSMAAAMHQSHQVIYSSVDHNTASQIQTSTYTAVPSNGDMSVSSPQQQYVQLPQHAHVMHQMQNMHISQAGATMQVYGYQPHLAGQPNDGKRPWSVGDYCAAKYWQDGKFYRAIVQQLDPTSQIAAVLFPDYGNTEHVSFMDMQPMAKQTWDASTGVNVMPDMGSMTPVSMPGILVQSPPQVAFVSAFPDQYGNMYTMQAMQPPTSQQ